MKQFYLHYFYIFSKSLIIKNTVITCVQLQCDIYRATRVTCCWGRILGGLGRTIGQKKDDAGGHLAKKGWPGRTFGKKGGPGRTFGKKGWSGRTFGKKRMIREENRQKRITREEKENKPLKLKQKQWKSLINITFWQKKHVNLVHFTSFNHLRTESVNITPGFLNAQKIFRYILILLEAWQLQRICLNH